MAFAVDRGSKLSIPAAPLGSKRPVWPPLTPTKANAATNADASTNGSQQPACPQRALGIDYGRQRIGVAISTLGLAPRPLSPLRGGGLDEVYAIAQQVIDLAASEQADSIVIGLPVTQNGNLRKRSTDSQQGRRCRYFADVVAEVAISSNEHCLNTFLMDERGTTMDAESLLREGGRRSQRDIQKKADSVAAALILISFFANPSQALLVRPRRNRRS
jgi:putative Holliday junction resolvase